MAWEGQREAHRPQRMQVVSSFSITPPKAVELRAVDLCQLRRAARPAIRPPSSRPSCVVADLRQPGQADQILRANIHAAGAGDADAGIEDSVDIAAQAARGLRARHLLGKDFFDDLQGRGARRQPAQPAGDGARNSSQPSRMV